MSLTGSLLAVDAALLGLPCSCALATLGRSWLAPPLAALARRRRPWDVFLVWPSRRARPPPCRPSFRVTRDYKESLCRASYLLLVFAVFDDIGNVELYNTCRVQLDRWWRSSFPSRPAWSLQREPSSHPTCRTGSPEKKLRCIARSDA